MKKIKLRHEENAFFTHQPVLLKALKESVGPVLELGSGEGSTELIHNYCSEHNRKVTTVENDISWMNKYKNKLHNEWHEFVYIDNWEETVNKLSIKQWGLVFIDQDSWIARSYSFKKLVECSDFIVLHDCDYFPENNLLGKVISPYMNGIETGERSFDNEVNNWKEFHPIKPMCWTGSKTTGPPTLLASNKYSCDFDINFSTIEETY